MPDGPMMDRSGFIIALHRVLPSPLKDLYRAIAPQKMHDLVRDINPYTQNIERAARFWMNPADRHRKQEQLRNCRTGDDYFAFASGTLGHQQWKEEILGFLDFAKEAQPVRICEIGLFLGGTNLMLTHALPTVRQIIGVDMHVRNATQLRYFAKPSQKHIFVQGKSCDAATLKGVTKALNGEKLDLLFIDGDHSYAGVREDFMKYRHFVREGGVIAFHDVVQDHLHKFGHDPATWNGARSGEVYLFWQRLKSYYPNSREFVADYEQDGCGIGAITYSPKVEIPEDV